MSGAAGLGSSRPPALVLLLGLGLPLGGLLAVGALHVEELSAAAAPALEVALAYWDPGPGCVPIERPWHEVPGLRAHRERMQMPVLVQMRRDGKGEHGMAPPTPLVRFRVCVNQRGRVDRAEVLDQGLAKRLEPELRQAVATWRYAEGEAHCYQDLAWISWRKPRLTGRGAR